MLGVQLLMMIMMSCLHPLSPMHAARAPELEVLHAHRLPRLPPLLLHAEDADIDDVVRSLLCLPLTSELDSRMFSYEPYRDSSSTQQQQQASS